MEVLIIFLAGLSEGVMDWLQFRYFVYGGSTFWNPSLSWVNKWKPGTTNVERFWQSSRSLVFLTDGWHLMKFFRNLFIFLTMLLVSMKGYNLTQAIIIILAYRLVYGIGFAITYNIKRNK